MRRIDVKLTNGDEDACIVTDGDAMTIIEGFAAHGVLMIGDVDKNTFVSLYPAASVFSFSVQQWEK